MTELELLVDQHKDLERFLSRHENNQTARDIVEGEKREIKMYRRFKQYYSYGFYIAQKLQ